MLLWEGNIIVSIFQSSVLQESEPPRCSGFAIDWFQESPVLLMTRIVLRRETADSKVK